MRHHQLVTKDMQVPTAAGLPTKGFVSTEIQTREGDHTIINWKNADVDLPILSTHELAKNGHRLEYDELDGVIRNKATGKTTGFYAGHGVYWLPMLVKKHIAGTQDFGRQG